jgi:serine/threonine-protein kinase
MSSRKPDQRDAVGGEILHYCGSGEILGGRYELNARLGMGGAGVVWASQRHPDGEEVAVKVLGERGEQVTRRLRREAELIQSVRHFGLVRVHEIVECEISGLPALVMDLLRGEDLAKRIARAGKLEVVRLATLLLPAVDALVALHDRAIAHRDLKPSNLFLVRDEVGVEFAKVLDLGMARCLEATFAESVSRLTDSGVSVGTPHYMAPEQLMGARDVDCLADVWAMGVVLFEAMSGRSWTIPASHLRGEGDRVAQSVNTAMGDAPASVRDLIVQCLSLARHRRPTMKQVRDTLAAVAVVPALPAGAFKAT